MTILTTPATKKLCIPADQTIVTDLSKALSPEDQFYFATLERFGIREEEEGLLQRMENAKRLAQTLRS